MINAQVNMARLVETQTQFAIECDGGFLIGYNKEDDSRLLIKSGQMLMSVKPENVMLIQEPAPHLAIRYGELTACVDITKHLSHSLLSLYTGICQ